MVESPRVKLSTVLSAMSYALDLTEGQPLGHAARSCLIGMRLADVVGLTPAERSDLFYALLMKDAGCSSNAARVYQLFGGDDQPAKSGLWHRDLAEVAREDRLCPRVCGAGRVRGGALPALRHAGGRRPHGAARAVSDSLRSRR